MPAGKWRFQVRKTSGPAGLIRVTFEIASVPSLSSSREALATPQGATAKPGVAKSSLTALKSVLGVLRREQVQNDLPAWLSKELRRASRSRTDLGLFGTPVCSLVRLITTPEWGQKVFLVPMLPPTRRAIAQLPTTLRGAAHNTTAGFELYPPPLGRSAPYQTVAEINRGVAFDHDGGGRLVMIFPDNVTRVELWPASAGGRPVTTSIHDNVAAFKIPTNTWDPGREIWYGPSGRVIKRIRNATACTNKFSICH